MVSSVILDTLSAVKQTGLRAFRVDGALHAGRGEQRLSSRDSLKTLKTLT